MLTNSSRLPQEPPVPRSQLSEPINRVLQEKGLAIKDLAVMLDVTYEHARRLVRGEGIPSRPADPAARGIART